MQTLLKINGGFMKASDFLEAGIKHLSDRAASYDAPYGERSMSKTVAIFNELLAEKLREPLSEEDGWNFMQILKMVRSKQGEFKADSYEDGAAYAGLAGEAAAKNHHRAFRESGFFAVKGGYSSFKECIADAKKMRSSYAGIIVATKDVGGIKLATRFDSNYTAASHIEKHRDCSMIVWIDDMAVYDRYLAKDGELDRLLEHLKK